MKRDGFRNNVYQIGGAGCGVLNNTFEVAKGCPPSHKAILESLFHDIYQVRQ